MELAEQAKAEQDLEELTKALHQWRQTREKLGAIPEKLWEEATTAARTLGINKVSRTLGVNYRALQERMKPRASGEIQRRGRGRPPKSGGQTFVELPRAVPPSSAAAEGTLEVVAPDGARLTLRLKGSAPMDLVALVSAFRESRR